MQEYFWFTVFAGANGVIIVALAFLVSWRRISRRVPHGDGGQVPMKQAIRAHGNAIEHVPIMGLLVLAMSLQQAAATLLAVLVIGFTLGRLLHPLGMLTSHFNARRLGALLSYLTELIAAFACLRLALA